MLGGIDLPQFLDADAIGLRLDSIAEVIPLHQLFAEAAATALGEKRLLAVQLHTGLVIGAGLAGFGDSHVAGGDTLHRSVVVIQHLGGGETGINLDPQALGLFAQPAAEITEADHVIAVILQTRRQQKVGKRQPAALRQEQKALFRHRGRDRRAHRLPVGQQLVERPGLQHRARQDMRTDLGAFFDDADAEIDVAVGAQLLEPNRRRQPGWAGADDYDIVFHRLPFHLVSCVPIRTR